jgi:hypothetical protein
VRYRKTKQENQSNKLREMGSVSNIGFSSTLRVSLDTQLLSKQRKHKSPCSFIVPFNYSVRINKICCKLSESGIEDNPTTKRVSKSKDMMEEYNIAMKKMMRNPYEYHHDLGQFHFYVPICFAM